MLLFEHDLEIVQGRMIRPQLAGERVLLRRDREQEHVVDRHHGPDEHGNADQEQPRLGAGFAERGQPHRDNRFIMKYTSGNHERQRADDRGHRKRELVEPQIPDAERRQHVGEVGRSAAGQEIDAVEVAERPDHREQRAGDVERLHRRPGDEAEFLPPGRAVDVGGLEQIVRDRKPSGDEDQGPERQRFPDVHADRHGERHRRIVQPVRAVIAGELEDQLVDHAPFGIEHEAHRQDGRDRRHRPGQDEQHRQPFDPAALLDEEAGQEQRDQHLDVDADQRGRSAC